MKRTSFNSNSFRALGLLLFVYVFCASEAGAKDYFQQKTDFTIQVLLNDKSHELSCFETIQYTNNSPDTLKEIYLHLWPNAYKDENTPLAVSLYESGKLNMQGLKPEEYGYVDSLDFKVNGEKTKWHLLRDSVDICIVKLKSPLLPGASLELSTPFHVKIPSAKISRLGHQGQAYYITQWFPKPAVYDKNGWNYFSYTAQGEFYGEYGTYDVTITLPENYVIGTSAKLIDGEKEILWLQQKSEETVIADSADMSFPPSTEKFKSLHFRQENIHDFAWFADKRYHVLTHKFPKAESNDSISVYAFYTNDNAKVWKDVPQMIEKSIRYYSDRIGPYPYDQFTAVDVVHAEGEDMEYPLMTAVGSHHEKDEMLLVIAHEVAHAWFYASLGNNEQYHAWMDEGPAGFYETEFSEALTKSDSVDSKKQEQEKKTQTAIRKIFKPSQNEEKYRSYINAARSNVDQSPGLPAAEHLPSNYLMDMYSKAPLSLRYLQAYLGSSVFDLCMHDYYSTWKFRHPGPEDMKESFEKSSGKTLGWFFDDLMNSNKKLDYKMLGLEKSGETNSYRLSIKNKGSIAGPFSVSAMRNDSVILTKWHEGFRGTKSLNMECGDCTSFRIDAAEEIPELYRKNNSVRTSGLLRHMEKLSFQFPFAPDDPMKTQVYYSPVAGWNLYNGVMLGIALYNVAPPEKKFEYTLAPLFAFNTLSIAGGGDLRYHIYPRKGIIQKITLRSGFSHYAFNEKDSNSEPFESEDLYFSKSDNRMVFDFRPGNAAAMRKNSISLRHVWIQKDLYYYPGNREYNYYQAEYAFENQNPLKASETTFGILGNREFYKISLESKHFIPYNSTKKGFRWRFYAGYLKRYRTDTWEADYRLRSSGYSGTDDYLFDEVFFGRTEIKGIWSQQFYTADGGLKIPTLFFKKGEEWMGGLNISTTLPGKIPFRLYAGIVSFDHAKDIYPGNSFTWEAGVELPIINDIFVIYFPLLWSSDMQYIADNQNLHYGNLIRWELRLTKLNPLEFIRKFEF